MTDPTPRWRYRFDSFAAALARLEEALAQSRTRALSALEQEGLAQRFEFTVELAWKTMGDLLRESGASFLAFTPQEVVRQAFAAGLIEDGALWMDAIRLRNRLSHIYSERLLQEAIPSIAERFHPALARLRAKLTEVAAGPG